MMSPSQTQHHPPRGEWEPILNSQVYDLYHFTWTVYLQTPRVFHNFMVLSRDPETICRLSEEKATLSTSLVWPTNRLVVVPLRGRTWSLSRQILPIQSDPSLGSIFAPVGSIMPHSSHHMWPMSYQPMSGMCQRTHSELQDMSSFPCGDWLTMSSCHHQDPLSHLPDETFLTSCCTW